MKKSVVMGIEPTTSGLLDQRRSHSDNQAVTFLNFLKLQTSITANWGIAQKYVFHYHNLVFMLNLILWITYTGGRVPLN